MLKTLPNPLLGFKRIRSVFSLYYNNCPKSVETFPQCCRNVRPYSSCYFPFNNSPLVPFSSEPRYIMNQTKISQFFTKKSSTSSPTSSPVKKPEVKVKPPRVTEDEDKKEEEKKPTKSMNGGGSKSKKEDKKEEVKSTGRKRKSKTSSEEEEDDPKEARSKSRSMSDRSKGSKESEKSSSAKRKAPESNGNKKPRRRIVVQDSSSESEAEERMEVEEPEKGSEETNGQNKRFEDEEEAKEVKKESKDSKKKSESPKEKPTKDKPEPKNVAKGKKSPSPKLEKEVKGRRSKNEEEDKDDDKGSKAKKEKEDDKLSKGKKETEDKGSKTKKVTAEDEKASKDKKEKEEEKGSKGKDEKEDDKETKEEKDGEKLSKAKAPLNTLGGGASSKGWNSDYNPSKTHYHPIDDASWKRGEKVPYLALSKTLEQIEATSSRLKFVEILANYFRSVIVLSPSDLLFSVYLCLNKLAPAYEGIELGVAETNIMKAIAQATGRSLDKIKSDAGTLGDLGLVAENSRSSQKTLFQPQPLTVSGVFHKLKEIANMHGTAAQGKKISMITSMLVACKYSEARYLTRSLAGKLRIGLAEQSLLQALSQATYLTPPNQDMSEWPPKILNAGKKMSADSLKAKIEAHTFIVKSCFCDCPSYDILVKGLLDVGIDGLEELCKLTTGIPPRPMLAQPTKGVADVLERFEGVRFTCEYKYDGERAQIHLSEDGTLNIYSRNQENNTSKYPDIITRFNSCIKTKGAVQSCILDAEAVAWDIDNKMILPFQVLSTRKRKDANEAEIKVQVCIFAFDLIYLNGKSLIKEPLFKRRELLREHFQEVAGEFLFATSLDTDSMEEVQEFLEESIKGNCEGLMVKTLDERATYELAKRSQKWLKLKKDYLDSGGDSLDLVVIGGFYGKGKRAGHYGGFLLACYDPDEEVYQTICKIGTGFSDEQLQSHSEFLKPHVIPSPKSYYRFNPQLTPDQWFDAVQVWEVKCADLSLSPVHTAAEGIADTQRGVSLRFPRYLRIRDDKNIEDATSSQQVADMYKNQEQVKNATGKNVKTGDEDEFY